MTGDEQLTLLQCYWGPRARTTEKVHYRIATTYAFFRNAISLAIVILSAFTASTLFATLSNTHSSWKIALAIVSILAAVLAGIDRSTGFATRAENHRRAGADWCPIVNSIERARAQLPQHPVPSADIDKIDAEMAETTKKSPYIPEHYFKRYKLGATYMDPVSKGRGRQPKQKEG